MPRPWPADANRPSPDAITNTKHPEKPGRNQHPGELRVVALDGNEIELSRPYSPAVVILDANQNPRNR